MLYGLTHRQKEVLLFIDAYIRQHGVAPSMREIAKGTGLGAHSNVHRYIKVLCTRGWLRYHPRRARTLWVNEAVSQIQALSAPPVEQETPE